jgi:1-acyl-sn-glycerol-3-phosphate acyltransferase
MPQVVYPAVIAAAKTFSRALGLRIRVEGARNLPQTGGAAVAINHIGYLDFVYAGWAADQLRPKRLIRFAAKKEVFDHPVAGPLMRNMRHIAVDRESGASSYVSLVAALRRGELVGMFPEATISRSFCLKDFKNGAARMAAEAGVPLVPLVVWGTQRLMTKGRPTNLQRGITILDYVGEPLHPTPADDPTTVTAELKSRMQTLLEKAQADYPDQPADDDDRWWLPVHLGGTAPTLEEASDLDRKEFAARRAKQREAARAKAAEQGDERS